MVQKYFVLGQLTDQEDDKFIIEVLSKSDVFSSVAVNGNGEVVLDVNLESALQLGNGNYTLMFQVKEFFN